MFQYDNVIRLWIQSEMGEVECKEMKKTLEKINMDVIKGLAYVCQNGNDVTVVFPYITYKIQLGGK